MLVTESLAYNMQAANAGMTQADFTPITTTAGFQMGIVSPASKGWKDFKDVIAAAKGGEQIRFGVMSPKLADLAYLLGKANDVDFNIVSVKGGKGRYGWRQCRRPGPRLHGRHSGERRGCR